MSEIIEFLLARLAEDERVVRYASVNAHRPALHLDGNGYVVVDPARVLAEVEAKRRIVALCSGAEVVGAFRVDVQTYAGNGWRPIGAHDHVLHLLALPYADHPDYRQEWRP